MVADAANDPRPLPGEPLALDLLNTQWLASGQPVDLLATADGTVAWLAAANAATSQAAAARRPLVQARQAICEVLAALNEPARQPPAPASGHATGRPNGDLAHRHLPLTIRPPPPSVPP